MAKYIILPNTTNIQDGWNISNYIFQLSKPNAPGTTQYFCSVIQHPSDGRVALVWPDNGPQALIQSTEKKANILGEIEAEYGTVVRDLIDTAIENNSTLDLTQFVSTNSYSDLETDGWFPENT